MTTEDRSRQDTRAASPGRVPPHDVAAERSILGAAMLAPSALEVLALELVPGDFYVPAHGHVASALKRCFEEGLPADSVSVADLLRRAGLLDTIGGPAVLAGIMAETPATTNAGRYASIVHDLATLRRMIGVGAEISEIGYALPADTHGAVLRAQVLLDDVSANNGNRAYSTLDVADVTALLDSDLEGESPSFLTRADGQPLIYAGKMHVFQGEPSTGKTWLALLAVLEVLGIGGSAIYIDFEDTAKGILGRLLAIGAEPAHVRERFAYVQPSGGFGPAEKLELGRMLDRLNPDLVVIDGVAEALARDGLSEDRASEVVGWIERLPRWISRTGAAVVMLDHLVKAREEQGRYARGSGAKLAAVDGAAYLVRLSSAFSKQRAGAMKVIIAKDRPGGVGAIGETAALAKIEPKGDGARVIVSLEVDTGEAERRTPFRPTGIMRALSDVLESSSIPITASALKTLVVGKPKHVSNGIALLIAEGYVVEVRQGRSTVLRLEHPFRDGDPGPTPPEQGALELEETPDNVTRGPWPEPSPDDPVGF